MPEPFQPRLTLITPRSIPASPGMYPGSLTAGNGYGGNLIAKTSCLGVNTLALPTPVVDFSTNTASGYASLQVKFTGLSTDGVLISRAWTFSNNGIPLPETTPARKLSTPLPKGWSEQRLPYGYSWKQRVGSLEKSYYTSVKLPEPGEGTITFQPGWGIWVSMQLPLKDQYRTAGPGSCRYRQGSLPLNILTASNMKKLFSIQVIRSNFSVWNSIKIVIPANQDKIVKAG